MTINKATHENLHTIEGSLAALLSAIVRNDADAVCDSYAANEKIHVFVEGPRWETIGHNAVSRGWRDFCASDKMNVEAIELQEETRVQGVGSAAAAVGSIAVIAGSPKMVINFPQLGPIKEIVFRLTWVMERQSDRWRIVHEHASQPLTDPYGVGDWLRPESA